MQAEKTRNVTSSDAPAAPKTGSKSIWRKIVKGIGITIGAVLGLLVLALVALYIIGGAKWKREYMDYEISVESIAIPTDEASIARGEHIAATRYCAFCHGEDLSGGYLLNQPAMLVVPIPNLTPGAGGIGASYTDEDWIRTFRHGVAQDGRGVIGMPARLWARLGDEDLADLVAYLKTLPPVDNELPARQIGPLGRIMLVLGQLPPPEPAMIDHQGPRPLIPEPGVNVAYGEYLAHSSCSGCHGLDYLNGGTIRGHDGELEVALNLTPGGRLALWSEADFMTTLRTGVAPDGHMLSESMPWRYVGQMSDEELKAIWLFLQAQPPLEQNLERSDPPPLKGE